MLSIACFASFLFSPDSAILHDHYNVHDGDCCAHLRHEPFASFTAPLSLYNTLLSRLG